MSTPAGHPETSARPRPTVFLSYASEDRRAAQLLRDALPGFGLEVWYDESDLVGGDAWDQKIRRQIRECDYFMPVISAHTEARHEGYFRREWRLAV
ncbi:MAG TPA: toll/interleukin-1 receptor domain-containing protein, partial [Steroidobacteraceae bacterium]|nr:toll/interleukin-1 receptor domain-containing protein [Steroidobacteraceae bacterium]